MKKGRIEKAVDIIKYAIENHISVNVASVKCGYAHTYVKNIKAIVYEKYYKGNIDDELFTLFNDAYTEYLYYRGFAEKNDDLELTNDLKQIPVNDKKPLYLPKTIGEKTTYKENGYEATLEWVSDNTYPDNHIKTLNELLIATDVDLEAWKVKEFSVNKWDVTSFHKENSKTVQNFQVKARLEKNIKLINEKAVGEIFKEMVKNYKPPVTNYLDFDITVNSRLCPTENNLLEISIFDLHLGKLAWAGETGENYDTKIASARFLEAINKLIESASGFQYSRILFPVGNDFFNSDNLNNTTTHGTPQSEDLRWQKTFNSGVKLLVDAINLLKQSGVPVDVIVIPGNHDFERSYYMGAFLEAWFNNDPVVNINNGASPRKYYKFGKVLLGLTHGGEEKESSLPQLMATDIESKPMWSKTTYHEWHLGHIHRKRSVNYSVTDNRDRTLSEDLGVTIRYLSSLTGTEEWHHKKGFTGCIKAGEAFIWNDETGLIANLNANLIIK